MGQLSELFGRDGAEELPGALFDFLRRHSMLPDLASLELGRPEIVQLVEDANVRGRMDNNIVALTRDDTQRVVSDAVTSAP